MAYEQTDENFLFDDEEMKYLRHELDKNNKSAMAARKKIPRGIYTRVADSLRMEIENK